MAGEEVVAASGGGGGGFASFTTGLKNLLGSTTVGSSKATAERTATQSGQSRGETFLEIDPAAIEAIIQDVLGGTQGLADIFSGEKVSGLYKSTAAAAASGDLLSQLAGEIAKLTAKEVSTQAQAQTQAESQTQTQRTKQRERGILESIFG